MENAVKKKYRLSLLYLLKDLLKSMLIGAIGLFVFINILGFVISEGPFDMRSWLGYSFASIILGAIGGIVYRCIAGGEIGEVAGVTLYNVYAGIHNTFLFSGAGFSYNAAFAVIGLVLTVVGFIYKLACTVVVFPISFVYLCIMALLETIFNGLPEALGNILDKIVPITSKICGLVIVYFVLQSWQ